MNSKLKSNYDNMNSLSTELCNLKEKITLRENELNALSESNLKLLEGLHECVYSILGDGYEDVISVSLTGNVTLDGVFSIDDLKSIIRVLDTFFLEEE